MFYEVFKGVGALMAGIGGGYVAGATVAGIGFATTSNKLMKACVGVAAVTAESYAFNKFSSAFIHDADELKETLDMLSGKKRVEPEEE